MANLDDGTVGIELLAGLPKNNGLSPLAGEVLDDPKPVYALVELRPRKEVHNIDTDSHTVVLRIGQIEALAGEAGKAVRDQLVTAREQRTGERPMIGSDGGIEPDAAPERHEPDTGPGGTVPPAEVPTAASDTAADADATPAFTPPTPIKGARAKA